MKEDAAARRRRENAALLARMKDPKDSLMHTPASAYYWAPRPLIKKDQAELRRIYGETNGKAD
jgi:hypothetical protein